MATNVDINKSSGDYIYLAIAADPDETTPTVEDSFDVVTYSGTGVARTIETDFKPDLVWVKSRSATLSNIVHDSIRGSGPLLITNSTTAEIDNGSNTVDFVSNGFELQGGGSHTSVNESGQTYVAWVWKAGDHDDNLPQINTEGTIDSTVSVNAEAGFSIAKFTGNSTSTSTVGHGLSQAPELIFLKHLNFADNWVVYNSSIGATKALHLDLSNAPSTNSAYWNNTDPNSTTIQFGSHLNNTYNYIAYCFHSVTGYQKVGSYTGTGSSGNSVTTGFEPRFVMIKRTDTAANWNIEWINSNGEIRPNLTNAETSTRGISFNTNGFTLDVDWATKNASGGTYIYLAIK